ncbi:transcription factor HES-1-like [Heteronotia binoei]|uniref:transcription factor HES-1-like n=1 Tax=Heteronotia binoei TaxID=13085 RepID=UPI00292EE977|nr:transcription factor HES-1-like [Heteronotia binoei]
MDTVSGQTEPADRRGPSARNRKNPNNLYRKSIKPLIEKRRRARINASLEQLRKLLQTSPEPQNSRALSRLEKAQILEMTVQQLQQYKKQGATAPPSPNSPDFAAGYRHCINTVNSFLSSADSSLDQEMKSQILQQLEQTPGLRSSIATISRPCCPQKAVSVLSPPSSCLWAPPPPPPKRSAGLTPPLPDARAITEQSWSQASPIATPSPHPPGPWTQPNSPATATHMWRPW